MPYYLTAALHCPPWFVFRFTAQQRAQLWQATLVLLLAGALAVPQLNFDAFSEDELNSIIVSGGAHYGELTYPLGVIAKTNEHSPDQALGFPLIARLWGDFVGWSEFALRVLPTLAGLLTLALVYRLGSDLFTPLVGFVAVLSMATSTFYITYMHKFRTFTLLSLAIALTLWCYWRVALAPSKPGWVAHVGLVVGGLGLVYLHYFAVPVLVALGAYHLLFVRKDGRWWRAVGLFALVGLAFLPQVAFLLEGLSYNVTSNPDLRRRALSPGGVVLRMLTFFGNGIPVVTVGFLAGAATAFFLVIRNDIRHRIGLVAFLGVMVLLGIILMNELAGVMVPRRVRYLMPLWVPLSLLVGVAIWKIYALNAVLGRMILVVWAVFGVAVNIDGSLMVFDGGDDGRTPAWREATAVVYSDGDPGDAYLYVGVFEQLLGHYTHELPNRHFIFPYLGEADMSNAVADHNRVWLTWSRAFGYPQNLPTLLQLFERRQYVQCDIYWADELFETSLYAKSQVFCPEGDTLLRFGDDFTLVGWEQIPDAETLTVNTNWQLAPGIPLHTYSIGVYVFDDAGQLRTQQDVPLDAADGPYFPAQAILDVSALAPGDYTLRTAVYEWQTGERLTGQDLRPDSALAGTLLSLGTFTLP